MRRIFASFGREDVFQSIWGGNEVKSVALGASLPRFIAGSVAGRVTLSARHTAAL